MKYMVYIVKCSDGTLYTGITNDLKRRLREHQEGKGAKYIRGRLPIRLCYVEEGEGKSWALRRERAIKRLSRAKKEQLMKKNSRVWRDLIEDTEE